MDFKFNGLERLNKELDEIIDKVEALEEPVDVKLEQLLTDDFMQRHTSLSSLTELEELPLFKNANSFEEIAATDLDELIRDISNFESWDDMLGTAATEFQAKRLGL
jgi:hypothetical protein